MPTNQNNPAVYVQENGGPPPIAGVPTWMTAFIGSAARGPLNKPVHIQSFAAFTQNFGNLANDLELGYAVSQFFLNGGTDAWIVRIARQPALARIQKALSALDRVDIINLVALPGLTRREWIEPALDYCTGRRAFLIVDSPPDCSTPATMLQLAAATPFPTNPNGAIFFPRLKIVDPMTKQVRLCAPSGSIAGLFARMDHKRGVWKSPAGKDASLIGVIDLAYRITDADNQELNSRAINCLRAFPALGIVAWGGRTLAGGDTQASDWKYIPIRRLALFIEESVWRGTKWAVFESNDELLWVKLRAGVEMFLLQLFKQGAFQGLTPKDAYFVKCDRETMTQSDIDNGRINIVIGVAPSKPAEFVIIKIGQWRNTPPDPP